MKNLIFFFCLTSFLLQVQNYENLKACKVLEYLYFEALPKVNQRFKNDLVELVFPIEESCLNLELIENLISEINKNKCDKSQIISKLVIFFFLSNNLLKFKGLCLKKRIKLAIVSTDLTHVYYDFSYGLESPFSIDQLRKFDS